MELGVRRLRREDCELVAWLEEFARSSAADLRGGSVHLAETPAVGDWQGHIDLESRPTWVSTVDERPVGYLEAVLTDRTLVVRQVFVHPEARDLGLGDDLLAAAMAHARRAGCRRLEGSALPGDRLTKNLYERAGITARKIILSMTIDD